jgi:excisionase family DNA binding protein
MSGFKTISTLSKELSISTSWLYKKVESRQIPFHKFGTHIRFSEEDVAEIIKNCECLPLTSPLKTNKTVEADYVI